MNPIPSTFALPKGALPAIEARLARLEDERFVTRLWERDPTLWGDDPAHVEVARNRLGWLGVPERMRAAVDDLEAFAREVTLEGYTHAVLLGMGGSSLAPEVLRRALGLAPRSLDLEVLDSTSPAAVRAVTESHDPAKTLFVVSSKSGGTIEVTSFERHCFEWARAARGDTAGGGFVAITDPGTGLERLARERGYRRTFTNQPDIGGRYSALSYFGLVPAALIGADLTALLERALEEDRASRAIATGGALPTGFVLGAVLGELALQGRDKLTLVLGPEVAAFGTWVEQLVAESTGKNGRGIVPIADEPLGLPESYADDRVFVAFSTEPLPAGVETGLEDLARAGHPVLRWRDRDLASIGEEFLRWEIATATAGAILGVDPFDEPNVTEAKQETQAVLAREQASPTPRATGNPLVSVEAPELIARELAPVVNGRRDLGAWAAALTTLVRPGDYFAVLAYLHRTPARHERLQRIRLAARGTTRAATTLGYGPRFLHSTGQLHKGGPNSGVFLLFTADDGGDVAIPGSPFGFAALIRAQAAGDFEVLERRGRRVVHLHLGEHVERELESIAEAIAAVRV